MKKHQISPAALKMAWKMIDTIFARHAILPREADRLLMAATIVSLDDLCRDRALTWSRRLPAASTLCFEGRQVLIRHDCGNDLLLKRHYGGPEVDAAVEAAEALFVPYGLPEIEIATLYTALPCLGLQALEAYLDWRREPPFPELG